MSLKISIYPLQQCYLHTYEIIHAMDIDTSQTLTFTPFSENSLVCFFTSLEHRAKRQAFPKAAETWTHLTTDHVSIVFLSI